MWSMRRRLALVTLIALTLAIACRWQRVRTSSADGLTVRTVQDRWTRQVWIAGYGVGPNGKVLNGQSYPLISDEATEKLRQAMPEAVALTLREEQLRPLFYEAMSQDLQADLADRIGKRRPTSSPELEGVKEEYGRVNMQLNQLTDRAKATLESRASFRRNSLTVAWALLCVPSLLVVVLSDSEVDALVAKLRRYRPEGKV